MSSNLLFWIVCLCRVAGVSAQEPKASPPAGLPDAPGVYYSGGAGKWTSIARAEVRDSSIRRMEVFLETGGMLPMDMTSVFPGPAASLQLSDTKPVFFVRGLENAREALVARLARKKDSRTVRTRSSEASQGNKAGFGKADIRRVSVTALEGGVFSVSVAEDLKPGEYLLTFGNATSGYDFGIRSR